MNLRVGLKYQKGKPTTTSDVKGAIKLVKEEDAEQTPVSESIRAHAVYNYMNDDKERRGILFDTYPLQDGETLKQHKERVINDPDFKKTKLSDIRNLAEGYSEEQFSDAIIGLHQKYPMEGHDPPLTNFQLKTFREILMLIQLL